VSEREEENEEGREGSIAHPPEGEQQDSLESEETLSPDELGED
jgi:hypothetical protein